MRARSKRLIAAAALILTCSCPGYAQVQVPAFKLVWLVESLSSGKPLGVFVWPSPMPLGACRARALRNQQYVYMPFEKTMGDYISDKLGEGIDAAGALCLTTEEAAALVQAVKDQEVQADGEDA